MKHRQIINIITFIRGVEPRAKVDLVTPVLEQIKLIDKYQFHATFLVQYDALIMPEYQNILKSLDKNRYEIGVWFEVPQPLAEDCGLTWTGRFPWDWHCHCGFSVGYTHEQKKLLLDQLFSKFKEIFGYYPKSFGSWFFDTFTVRYANDTYGLDALCNCKEQYGTDGYTLWGGYYGQGYYPSKTNVFMPAQTPESQINVPLFRMLGSDPVYQYDFGMDLQNGAREVQTVITLEPAYDANSGGGGGMPKWVDWYLKENFNDECLSFGYAQAGQENSFGWPCIKNGLTYQFARFDELVKKGELEVLTLGDTGRWFKTAYPQTPASTITAHGAFNDPDIHTVWYSSKQYRTNLYLDSDGLRIRDLHVFSESFPDPYEHTLCTTNDATYDTLPVADGNLNSGNGIRSGLYLLTADGSEMHPTDMIFNDLGSNTASVRFSLNSKDISFLLEEDAIEIRCEEAFVLQHRIGKANSLPKIIDSSEKKLCLSYKEHTYTILLESGNFTNNSIQSENGIIRAVFQTK